MTETEDTQTAEAVAPAETKMQKFERERLARRAALKKMGVTSALSVFALFSVDDLARMVGKAMKQYEGDSRIADQIAHEFREAGVAMASSSRTGDQPPLPGEIGISCNGNPNAYGKAADCLQCVNNGCNKYHAGAKAAIQACVTNESDKCKAGG